MGAKYIIEFEDEPFVQNGKELWKTKNFASLVFDQNGINRLTPYIESAKAVDEWPNEGDVYYLVNSKGVVRSSIYNNVKAIHSMRKEYGNVYKTEAEAEFAMQRSKVCAELTKYAEPLDTPWDGRKHYTILFNASCNEIEITEWVFTKCGGDIWFKTKVDADIAVKNVGEDRVLKYYFGISD